LAAAKKTPATPAAAAVDLQYPFTIVVTLTGMNRCGSHSREFLQGVSAVVLHREPSNPFDPDHAIRVDICGGVSNNNNIKKIGYVISMKNGDAKLLAPWMDRGLLRIDSAIVHHIAGPSTMELLAKGFACEDAQMMLDSLAP
jgi:hypothetical protein